MSSEDDAQFEILTNVGSRLRAAREAKQLSLRQIADTTKISVSALEALEENDVARLPGGSSLARSPGPTPQRWGWTPNRRCVTSWRRCLRK